MLLHRIADHADRNPTAAALLAPGRRSLTYARLCAEIEEHARSLRAIDLGKEDRVALVLPNGPRLDFDDVPAYFLERLQNVWHTLTRRTRPARATAEFLRPVLRRLPSDNMHLIGRRYRPKPYTGRVVLVRRSLRAISRYLDSKLGWEGVIGGEFEIVEIQGGHSDMFNEPQVQCTAATLAAYLQDRSRSEHQCRLSREVG
jgi:thioesterase domain-containing protein